MSLPKFSALTISYNHGEFIRKTIESVLEQNYPNFEHIIVDGGSTDDTLGILKSFSHLNWISEPDTGISNALNKGFKRATGDVIAWINSDDWYEPGTFHEVAKHISSHSIVMGNSVETDRIGTPIRTTKNSPRTFYDMLRYWIPNGWLAQPAVFFARAALESIKLPNGDYIDESYDYSMDYEFWLRLSERFPLECYVDRTFSYYRVYGENKTGRTFATPQRELGRAFRWACNRVTRAERKVTFVVPVCDLEEDLPKTVEGIMGQDIQDFDLVVVDYSKDKDIAKLLKQAMLEIEEASTTIGVRYLRACDARYFDALNIGARAARSQLVAFLRPGDNIPSDFARTASTIMAHDTFGIALVLGDLKNVREELLDTKTLNLNLNSLFELEDPFLPFVVRSIVMQELGGFAFSHLGHLSFREFILRFMNRGWGVSIENGLTLTLRAKHSESLIRAQKIMNSYDKARMILSGHEDSMNDPFYSVRAATGCTPTYSEQNISGAIKFLSQAPSDWDLIDEDSSSDRLEQTIREHPNFSPAWYYLSEKLSRDGRTVEAQSARERFKSLRPELAEIFS